MRITFDPWNNVNIIMRKILILFFALAATIDSFSQFDMKKDVLLKDKQPYAQITGSSKFAEPVNVTVSSLSGDSLLTIKTWRYPSVDPKFNKTLFGYRVRFIASGKTMVRSRELDVSYTRKDKIYKEVVRDITQDLIVNNAINPAAEAELLKLDITPAIDKAAGYEKSLAEYLKEYYPIPRTTEAKVTLKNAVETKYKDNSLTRTQEVWQNQVYLGKMTTRLTGEAVYTLELKNEKPFVYGDEKLEAPAVAIAIVEAWVFHTTQYHTTFPLTIHSNLSGKDYEIKVAVPNKAELEIAQYLVDNKLL
jgi:hypothetical protein